MSEIEASDASPRPDFLSQEQLWELFSRRRRVLSRPEPYIEKVPDEMSLMEVRRIGLRIARLVEKWKGQMPEMDMPGLGHSYERRGVRNLGSMMLRHGDVTTAKNCLAHLREMETGRFNIRRTEELWLAAEIRIRSGK